MRPAVGPPDPGPAWGEHFGRGRHAPAGRALGALLRAVADRTPDAPSVADVVLVDELPSATVRKIDKKALRVDIAARLDEERRSTLHGS